MFRFSEKKIWLVLFRFNKGNTFNSFCDGQLGDLQYVSVLERFPSYRESNKGSKERQGPTLGVHFTEVSVFRGVR